jgi:molecular chaperone GrpE
MFGPFKKDDENKEQELNQEEVEETESSNSSEDNTQSDVEAETEEFQETEAVDAEDVQVTDSCEQELAKVKDTLIRLGADFQNYKRRIEKDRSHWAHMIQSEMIVDLLPVVDDFDRALEEVKKEEGSQDSKLLEGITMIHKGFNEYLKKQDVAPIEQMQTFDPELHEALMQVESEDHKEGDIVQVLQRGFALKGKVIRPAKVSVCK